MATVTLRSLAHGIPSVTSRSKYHKYPSLSIPFSRTFFLKKQERLAIRISPVTSRRISAYASSDTEVENQEREVESEFVNEKEGKTGEEVVQAQPAKAAPKRLRKDRARLYVGNIPFSTTADELAELFSEAGTVNSVDVRFLLLYEVFNDDRYHSVGILIRLFLEPSEKFVFCKITHVLFLKYTNE